MPFDKIIDYRVNKADAEGTEFWYIKDVLITVGNMGYKAWLEAPVGTSLCLSGGMAEIPYLEEEEKWRGVHGYVAFGYHKIGMIENLPPDLSFFQAPIFGESQFINWKYQLFRGDGLPTALRVWARPGVFLTAYVILGKPQLMASGAVLLKNPNTGDDVYPPP